MFRESINRSIDPIPEEYIQTLRRLDNEPDYSLTSLGIALLRPRIENYGGIDGEYRSASDELGAVQRFIETDKEMQDGYPVFCYYRYNTQSESTDVEKKLKDAGFEIKTNIGAFLKDKADIKCVAAYHKTRNSAAIFINSSDMRFYHLIISFISLLYPAIFESKPLQPQDYEIVKALGKTTKDAFVSQIQKCVEPYVAEFRRLILTALLKAMHNVQVEYAERDVARQRESVNEIEERYVQAIARLRQLIITYEGLKVTETYGEPEENLIEYLSDNKAIHNLHISGSQLTFTVATLLNNYNADAWETFANAGYIYDGNYGRGGERCELLDVFKNKDNRKHLLNNIFNESPEFAVKTCGYYILDLQDCRMQTDKHYDFVTADPIYKSYIPNPHLKLYNCLGQYSDKVMRALRERNYIGAIEMCCASAGSVNLEETEQTFRPFIGWILNSREKILRRRDGVDMTPEEALVYLADKEKSK